MRQQFSEYDVWAFHKPDPDNWSWRRTSPDGEVLLEARGSFPTLDDCMADARRFGYSGTPSEQ